MDRKTEYTPGEKFSADMAPAFPDREKIVCRDCVFRKRGLMGEVNSFCDMYAGGMGKPYDVLFQNGPCQFYTKEEKAAD